jgi:hypothetical protein
MRNQKTPENPPHCHVPLNSRNILRISTLKFLFTVKEKGGKPDYAHKPQRNCLFMNSASDVFMTTDERVHRLTMATFLRTFHHDGNFGPAW